MQDSHWKITHKSLKPPSHYQRFQLRRKSIEVLEDFLRPRTASLHHTLSTKPSSTLVSRQGSIPGTVNLIARKQVKKDDSVAISNSEIEEKPRPTFAKVTLFRSQIHSYSLADRSAVYDLRCNSMLGELTPLQAYSHSSLLASIQTQLDTHLAGLKQEKESIGRVNFEPWGVKSSAVKAFAALKRGDWETVKKLVEADKTLVHAVDAVSAN